MMCKTPLTNRTRRGFTLVELLVVIAILALLLAILMPAIAGARKLAGRSVCAGNLRQMGTMALFHAEDFEGWFPTANRTHVNRMGWIMVWDNDSDPTNDNWTDSCWTSGSSGGFTAYQDAWKVCGTSWQTWLEYGMADDLAMCPEATRIPWTTVEATGGKPNYMYNAWSGGMGDVVGTAYPWISGAANKTCHTSTADWGGDIPPAWRTNDKNSRGVLAADAVWNDSIERWAGNPRVINHPDPDNPYRPDYQALLFADASVSEAVEYPEGNLPERPSWGYRADFAAKDTHGFYWNPD